MREKPNTLKTYITGFFVLVKENKSTTQSTHQLFKPHIIVEIREQYFSMLVNEAIKPKKNGSKNYFHPRRLDHTHIEIFVYRFNSFSIQFVKQNQKSVYFATDPLIFKVFLPIDG